MHRLVYIMMYYLVYIIHAAILYMQLLLILRLNSNGTVLGVSHAYADLDRCGEIDAVELCQHIFPVFVPAYVLRAPTTADAI
jgi:hypothetical protein